MATEVDEEKTHTVYLKKPFRESPDFAAKGVIYSLAGLKEHYEMIGEYWNEREKGAVP